MFGNSEDGDVSIRNGKWEMSKIGKKEKRAS